MDVERTIKNPYGGDTEWFNTYRSEIVKMAREGKTIPQICYYLFYNKNVMSTPDSLGGWFKAYAKEENVERKGKSILINDDNYQEALEKRAKENNCTYQCYSRATRQKKKELKKNNFKEKRITTENISNFEFNKLEEEIKELENKKKIKWEELPKYIGNLIETEKITSEIRELEDKIKEIKNRKGFLEGINKIAKYLEVDPRNLIITYKRKGE